MARRRRLSDTDVQLVLLEQEARCGCPVLSRLAQPGCHLRASVGHLPRPHGANHQAERGRRRELAVRSWGFILLRDGYAPKRVTNTRDDKANTRFWKDSFEKRRCLVPATAFCEPDEGKPANWHWFALRGEGERPLFAFPGIYRQWKGPIKKDGPNVDIEVFSFMTTLPNALTGTWRNRKAAIVGALPTPAGVIDPCPSSSSMSASMCR